ncbi:MAG: hypothetical protein IKH75_22550 [Ruminococcus sp.]|nr:hypothetical protein [Ruminococcus sp.]
MKNPMNENNINTELFEAIDENEVNGGYVIVKPTITKPIISSAAPTVRGCAVITLYTVSGCIRHTTYISCAKNIAVK